jgi:hypothetical protein
MRARDAHHVMGRCKPLAWPHFDHIPHRGLKGDAAMNAVAAPKSHRVNLLEGMTLTAIFQGVPTFAGAVLLLKLVGSSQIVGQPGGVAIFVALATLIHAVAMPYLGPRFPKFFKNSYEPVFFDATLSFSEKIFRWRTQPTTSLQLVTIVMMLSLLAVATASMG